MAETGIETKSQTRIEAAQEIPQVSKLRATAVAPLLILWILTGAATMSITKLLRLSRIEAKFPELFHGTVARLFNMNCVVRGTPHEGPSTFYVANHATYLDVFVLGGLIQGSFVAKSEVARWPVFGKLARLQNTLFLERKTQRAAEQVKLLSAHLDQGRNLIVFPEGTSTSGDYIAPFRSSLYRAAEGRVVQPVSVVYADYDGRPMTKAARDLFAWYLPDPKIAVPNKPFLNHFLAGLGLRPSTVHVVFHEPFTMAENGRKDAAQKSEAMVRKGLEALLEPLDADRHA